MAIPLLLHVASAAQALPIVAVAAVRGRNPPVPYRRIAIWCGLLVLADVADLVIAANSGDNHWTSYLTTPVEMGMTLWIVSAWQPDESQQRLYLRAIAAVGTAVAFLLVLTDPSQTFEVWIAPLLALVGLAAALHTLVTGSLRSREALWHLDWFWICIGLAVFWTVQISAPAFMAAFMTTHRDWVVNVLLVRAGLMIVAFLLIAWGIVCPRIPSR